MPITSELEKLRQVLLELKKTCFIRGRWKPRLHHRRIYANGFLLLTVAFVPFPTSLIGEYILTDHAAPAVILYDSVLALQPIGWIFICSTALTHH